MSRWPLEPLMALARTADGERMSMVALSRLLGMSEKAVQQWSKRGIPNEEKAERAAVVLGFDPYVVWPDMLQDPSRVCAYDVCDNRFVPAFRNPHQKFCSAQCRARAYQRTPKGRAQRAAYQRAYRSIPENAEANRSQRRAYYRMNREYERRQQADYYRRQKAQSTDNGDGNVAA